MGYVLLLEARARFQIDQQEARPGPSSERRKEGVRASGVELLRAYDNSVYQGRSSV